jgi:hypothetical protein
METCELCKKRVREVCNDLVCRKCHKSLSFEACVSGDWVDEQRRAAGLPPVTGYERK